MTVDNEAHQKVRADHLKRDAYLYIRQSTLQQVFHNAESTQRQYALKQRAVALGWPLERVIVIDSDLGASLALRPPTVRVSRDWSARWGWAVRVSCWGWRSRAWLATAPTGTACWRSVP